MTLRMTHNERLLVVQVILQRICHWVLVAYEVKWFAVRYEIIAVDEAWIEELVGDKVPLGPIEVDAEVGQTMLEPQLLSEVHVWFEHGLHLVDALRKARETIEWLLLPVHVVYNVVDGLEDVLKVGLRFRYRIFSRAIW